MNQNIIRTKRDGVYDFYIELDTDGRLWWNIVPKDQNAPESGYYDRSYIERMKHVKF